MASLKRQQLISEPLEPMSGFFNTSAMARGEPGLPCGFTWRGRELAIAEVLEQWKDPVLLVRVLTSSTYVSTGSRFGLRVTRL